jgi:copper chaperone CopZ
MTDTFTERAVFTSSKISGDGDVDRLEDNLSGREGVRDVNVNTSEHTVEVIFDPTVISEQALRGQVEELGYGIDSSSEQESPTL